MTKRKSTGKNALGRTGTDPRTAAPSSPGGKTSAAKRSTAHQGSEAALRRSENRIRSILNAVTDAIITIDGRGIITDTNPATDRMFGYSQDELVGRNIKILMPSPYREEHDGYLARYHETGEAHIIGIGREITARRKDGSIFPVSISVSEVDHLGLYTGVLRDISERKAMEETLRHEHDFTEKIINTANTIVLVLDIEGRVVRFNPFFEKLSGWRLKEAEGRDWFETFLPKRERKRIRELFKSALGENRTRGNINPILTKEGEERQVEWFDALLTDAEGTITGLLCTGSDVTRRNLLESQVVNAAEEERQRTARDLHDGVASLLTGIDYRAQALARELSRLELSQADEALRISGLIRDAIAQTRAISMGLHPVGSHPEDLTNALRALASRAHLPSGLACKFLCKSPVLVEDPQQANHLYRIAQEALNNALKHSGASSLTLSLEKRKRELVLKIVDDGAGCDAPRAPSGGLGLHTMEYRARAINGMLTIGPGQSGGTEVICSVPAEA